MILSYFDIGDIFYYSCKQSLLNRMQTLQNNALRYVFTNKIGMTVEEMHNESGLLLLSNRRKLNQSTLAHKHNISQFVYDNLKHPSLRSNLRITLLVPRANNRCFENSFLLKGIKLWNNLSKSLKSIPIYETKLFKTRVRKEMYGSKINFPE